MNYENINIFIKMTIKSVDLLDNLQSSLEKFLDIKGIKYNKLRYNVCFLKLNMGMKKSGLNLGMLQCLMNEIDEVISENHFFYRFSVFDSCCISNDEKINSVNNNEQQKLQEEISIIMSKLIDSI